MVFQFCLFERGLDSLAFRREVEQSRDFNCGVPGTNKTNDS